MHNEIKLSTFVDENGNGYTASTISCASFRRGKEAGIKKASIPRLRRRVSSELNTVLDSVTVANLLGHTVTSNLQCYRYNYSSLEEKLAGLHLVDNLFSYFSNIYPFYEDKKTAKAL